MVGLLRKRGTMRVLHLCAGDSSEGGAIGAYRLHQAMYENGIDTRLLVYEKKRPDPTVIRMRLMHRLPIRYGNRISRRLLQLHREKKPSYRTLDFFPTGVHRTIHRLNPDIVQMHWINRNTISIGEISKIKMPVVWKLPDMWAFSGAEHYMHPGDPERYRYGYYSGNRPEGDRGIDFDRFIWQYKRLRWRRKKISIVCPSRWLADCARRSILFRRNPVCSIPNPLDTARFRPVPNRQARNELGLPQDKELILFASFRAVEDPRKGFHYLRDGLKQMAQMKRFANAEIVIMGSQGERNAVVDGFRFHYLGYLSNERDVISAYCAADVIVLPTEADNLPNIIKEGTCCGTPCVGFGIGGLPDMINHKETGFLARPFRTVELVEGIQWVLDRGKTALSSKVREKAKRMHDPAKAVARYLRVYHKALDGTSPVCDTPFSKKFWDRTTTDRPGLSHLSRP
jgi:glycosyltransferase involved in cell wall biosynthesis